MSNKLIADLMSFRARMVSDARTQVMFEGDFDTIDQAIATLRKSPIAAPQQAIPSGWISVDDVKRLDRFPYGNNGNYEFRKSVLALVESASPTAPIERDK
jgi:hypothetical protein